MDLFPGNEIPSVYTHLIDIFAHIELLKSVAGMSKLRRSLQDNPEDINWRHALLQLELAGLALRKDWRIEFEPRHPIRGGADLALGRDGRRILLEMVAVGTDIRHRLAGEAFDAVTQLGLGHDVSLAGDAGAIDFDETDLQGSAHRWIANWLAKLTPAAEAVTATGAAQQVTGPTGGQIWVSRGFGLPGTKLRGPGGAGEILPTIQARLADKARAIGELEGVWIRLDDVGALWYLTPWSRLDLTNKLASIEPALRVLLEPYPSLAGIVMSNAWAWKTPGMVDETERSTQGSLAMRRALRFQHYREVFMKARDERYAPDIIEFAEWYGDEPSWTSWALKTLNLPSLDELIIQA
jgi:hypothetical protein